MNKLTITQINDALESAFQSTINLPYPQRVTAHSIGDNATLRVDLYSGPQGSGFVVVAVVDLGWVKRIIVKQHGPEAWRNRPTPSLMELVEECRRLRAARYEAEASVYDLADADTKMADPDPAVQAEGATQRATTLAKRLQIKLDLPIPL